MTIDELIEMFVQVRIDLSIIESKEESEYLQYLLNDLVRRVDIIGAN